MRTGLSNPRQTGAVQPRVATAPTLSPAPVLDVRGEVNSLVTTTTAGPVTLGPGDLLDIGVFDSPELTARVRVTSDKDVSLPLLGKLYVGGMTPQQVQNRIQEELVRGDFVKEPQVTVFVAEYADQAVYVLGEVNKPGVYPVMGSHRVFDFISAAGGFGPRAGRSVIVTRRSQPNSPEIVHVSRDPNTTAENSEIGSGDTIFVGQAGLVYVVGDVKRSGGFLLDSDESLTVMQALALAEGVNPTASLKGARLVRTTEQGRQEITLDLGKILHSKLPDPVLQDRDVLYVPSSATRTTLQRGFEAAMQTAVGAAIYRF